MLVSALSVPLATANLRKPHLHKQYHENQIPPCKWLTVSQPLDHFAAGAEAGTFEQRVCVIDKYINSRVQDRTADATGDAPTVFFYVGNESPVEEYVNNTGLMYELAEERGNVLLVFVEHRYQGGSIPHTKGVRNCMAYDSVELALADYANLIEHIRAGGVSTLKVSDYDWSSFVSSPVIAFGGSYGGMLAAWIRFRYPGSVQGAIAASAPIWGLPLTYPEIDGAAKVLSNGMVGECSDNLKASFVLINAISQLEGGLDWLRDVFGVCEPIDDVADLLSWAQGPWFDLAEGDFPFPSSYITFAVGPGLYDLPAWPMKVACESLDADFGVQWGGDVEDVSFKLRVGKIEVDVDWDISYNVGDWGLEEVKGEARLKDLMQGVERAVGVWCNVTGELTCNDLHGCGTGRRRALSHTSALSGYEGSEGTDVCKVDLWGTDLNCWEPMNCNDNLNLPNCLAQGMGNDFFWPPTVDKGTTLETLLGEKGTLNDGCSAPDGLHGYPDKSDPWSYAMDREFGGLRISDFSNVVFSNGLLDPWSSAGVYAREYDGEMVQELNDSGDMIALILEQGAHHLDLFFSTKDDPEEVREARRVEGEMIDRWVESYWAKQFRATSLKRRESSDHSS